MRLGLRKNCMFLAPPPSPRDNAWVACWRMRHTWSRAAALQLLQVWGQAQPSSAASINTSHCTPLRFYRFGAIDNWWGGVTGILCRELLHYATCPMYPRTVSLLGPSPLNACRVLQIASYNSKCTHLLPNAAWGDEWRFSDRGDILTIIRFLTLNKDAIKETLPFLKFDLKSWRIWRFLLGPIAWLM